MNRIFDKEYKLCSWLNLNGFRIPKKDGISLLTGDKTNIIDSGSDFSFSTIAEMEVW
jgi:hypothetical protein